MVDRLRLGAKVVVTLQEGCLQLAAMPDVIGTIQGLVMQSMLAGDVERIRREAPRVFAIYLRGIRSTP